ncbi:MAG TPA: queuosine salvage family protein [Terriglobia bacterium]|nr:queuosine salvage family protein [Terriglobia bacterium]
MNKSLLDEIRYACAQVATRARHVQISQTRIPPYAAGLPLGQALAPLVDPNHHYLAELEGTLAFILTLDAVNFGSGYFPHLRKRPGLSGYFTIATALKEHFERKGPFSAYELSCLTADDCRTVFGQVQDEGPIDELMILFAQALKQLGRFLEGRFGGQFINVVEAANHSAEQLISILAEMPFFRDVEPYDGLEVPFYKRAQLTAADLALALHDDELGQFSDLDRLTIFADNLIPHVLRRDGILQYDDALAREIERRALIPSGFLQEVEIRACAVHAVELIRAELQLAGRPVTSMGLDYLLWNRGQSPEYKAYARHRTRTVYY